MAGSDSTECLLAIPPFTWLADRHRRRGEAFAHHSRQLAARSCAGNLPGLLAEDKLIGTQEPVRFIYGTAPLTFGVLRAAIDRLYRVEVAATRDVTDLGVLQHPDSAKGPAEQRRAA